MMSCSPAHCILILLTTTLSPGSVSYVPPVKVKLHGSATLSCSERCSGLVRWTVFHKRGDTLAECDQTSCRSVKEGYQMIHHQYLNGDLSLTITDADFSKRGWYTCDCDGKDLCNVHLQIQRANYGTVKVKLHSFVTLPSPCNCSGVATWTVLRRSRATVAECDQTSCWSVEGYQMTCDHCLNGNYSLIISDADFSKRGWYTFQCNNTDLLDLHLQIEALNTTVQTNSNESLTLDLDVPDRVKLLYESSGAASRSSVEVCTVDGRSSQCKPEYKHRALLTCTVQLRGVTSSDGGVYTVVDVENQEVIHTYTLNVQGHQPSLDSDQAAPMSVSEIVLLVLLLVVIVVSVVMIVRLRREIERLRRKTERNGAALNRLSSREEEETWSHNTVQELETILNNSPPNINYGTCG